MKLSVCMAVYNGAEFIKDQIDSILPQLGESDEIIISDDGSTDTTLEIVSTYNDYRIVVCHSKKRNIIKNFENALEKATGDVIFLADQDDVWFPNKVEITLRYMDKYDLVFSNASVFQDNINHSNLLYNQNTPRTGLLRNFIKNNYIGATMAFKKGILKSSLPFPRNIYMHDVWLAMVAELKGKTFFIDEPLIYYRRHGNNASETGEKSSNSFNKKISMRYYLASSLLKRFS